MTLRRGQSLDRYRKDSSVAKVNVEGLLKRTRYMAEGLDHFYPDSERCVRTLLEKLPIDVFPKFANRIVAGNTPEASLLDSYGSACPTVAKFGELVNAP